MNNTSFLQHLYKIENMNDVKTLIEKIEQEEREKSFSGDRKKAVSAFKQFVKNHHVPVLKTMKKENDGYYYTDSYILVKSKEAFLPLVDGDGFPDLSLIIYRALSNGEIMNVKSIDYNDINLVYTKDKNSFYDLMDNSGKTRTFAAKYLKAAIEFLGTDNIKVIGDETNVLKPIVLINEKTDEFVLISPCRKNPA